MAIKIETNYGLFFLKKRYDVDTCETFYDVYEEPLEDELNGNYVGEFEPSVFYDEDMSTEELEFFIMELEDFIINQ
jgi:hypothetical protein